MNPADQKRFGGLTTLQLLAGYKFVIGVLLSIVAFDVVSLLDRDLVVVVHKWILLLHADPHNPVVVTIVERTSEVSRTTLEELAFVAGLFGALHLVEGLGLWFDKRWAEYLSLISTAIFVPLEVYEIVEEFHLLRLATLVANLGAVVYLFRRLRRRKAAAS